MTMENVLSVSHSFTLLISPPASGKTRMLHEWIEKKKMIIFVSPLRALANEFFENINLSSENKLLLENGLDWNKYKKQNVIVVTPELLDEESILKLIKKDPIWVLDEFHLYWYWGQSFRPLMWEILLSIFLYGNRVIGLTATFPDLFLEECKLLAQDNFEYLFKIDQGNQSLKFEPHKIYYSFQGYDQEELKIIANQFESESKRLLIFCRYRSQVKSFEKLLMKDGREILTCLGGEVKEFESRKASMNRIDLIIATSVLSHGVNLPEIHGIILVNKIENLDFWIQMVGRGGRRGESYAIFTCERIYFPLTRYLKGWFFWKVYKIQCLLSQNLRELFSLKILLRIGT